MVVLQQKAWLPLCCCPKIPLEPVLKILLPVLAIVIEIFLAFATKADGKRHLTWIVYKMYDAKGHMKNQEKMQHISIYLAFVLSGTADLLVIFMNLPKPTSKLLFSLAFFVEAFVFATHLGGRDPYNILMHSIIVGIALTCVFFSLLRLKYPSKLLVNLGLGNCLLLQGTWFFQAAHFLFTDFFSRRGGNDNSIRHFIIQFIGEAFCWHVLIIAASDLVLWAVISLVTKNKLLRKQQDGSLEGYNKDENFELINVNEDVENGEDLA